MSTILTMGQFYFLFLFLHLLWRHFYVHRGDISMYTVAYNVALTRDNPAPFPSLIQDGVQADFRTQHLWTHHPRTRHSECVPGVSDPSFDSFALRAALIENWTDASTNSVRLHLLRRGPAAFRSNGLRVRFLSPFPFQMLLVPLSLNKNSS